MLLVGRMMALARGETSSESCEGGLGVFRCGDCKGNRIFLLILALSMNCLM